MKQTSLATKIIAVSAVLAVAGAFCPAAFARTGAENAHGGSLLLAQADGGAATPSAGRLDAFGSKAGYGANPGSPTAMVTIIGKLIGYLLALLGVVFTGLLIYAGFLWMTAAGNEEQIGKSKKMLVNAVVGLIIIVLAYTISNFVIDKLTTATTT